jgi:hypothetical protein
VRYTILSPVTFGPGVELVLSEQQLARRQYLVRVLEGGRVVTTASVQFKAGEVVECDGALPKAMASLVEPEPAGTTDAASAGEASAAPARSTRKRRG